MSNVNTVVISGFLVADPETRWTADDGESAIVHLGVAVRRSRKQEDGSYADESKIHDVEVFGKFALLVARKMRKKDNLTVSGRLEKQEWETDGAKRSKTVIEAAQIDSEAFFRRDEDVPAKQESLPTTEAEPAAEAPKTNDIPF